MEVEERKGGGSEPAESSSSTKMMTGGSHGFGLPGGTGTVGKLALESRAGSGGYVRGEEDVCGPT